MKKTEAEPLIVQEWRSWASEHVPPGERRKRSNSGEILRLATARAVMATGLPSTSDKSRDVHIMLLRRKEVVD